MGTSESQNRQRLWPPPEFWGVAGLAASFLAPFLPVPLALALGLIFLALAVRLFRWPASPPAETCVASAGPVVPDPEKGSSMSHDCNPLEQDFRVTFPGPFQHHDVVVDGWSVPFVKASFRPDTEDHVRLILDDRIGLDLTSAEAEKLTPFLADAISVALGYGAHPGKDCESLSERAPHATPRRVVRVSAEGASD